ncbi:helix-turn-helix transcriptional regulator (plasmid) [Microvirga terrae]|uniref:Helix-turn-helix transcriptional regulator n=1 Tax=Microvirga terrae TaxID=2740529 RepID=A0ABY5RZA9_9HYPH|nr:substrate-binding domain-containing protein [Microvirga terrae]UVF22187.1 helix-turn-helix transcriptional regulator [Microvirga terrae]
MRVELRLSGFVLVSGEKIALSRTYALLDGIRNDQSIRGAADRLGLSYRSAWDHVLNLEKTIGRPVAIKTKGHGSALNQLGNALLVALNETFSSFEVALLREEHALAMRLEALLEKAPVSGRLALSNDPLLMSVLGEIRLVEATVVGSREAVECLLAGRAEAAGFHVGDLDPRSTPPFDLLFHDRRYIVRPLFYREQGLMLAAGNPLSIFSVKDLTRTGARFVNRQPGSGTRQWFDRLLKQDDLSPSGVVGYDQEEFTHQAVAAVIASGAADAGMGVRAVAERFGLAFTALGREVYYIAAQPDLSDVVDLVCSRAAAKCEAFPGYAVLTPTDEHQWYRSGCYR